MDNIIIPHEGHSLLRLDIRPGASSTEFAGTYGDPARLKVKLSTPPVDGKANKALICRVLPTQRLRTHLLVLG